MQFHKKYTLIKEIGNVSKFGRIFSGTSKLTGDQVVLKFVTKNKADDQGAERLRNERLFNFQFEGLPLILDYFESDNECILVRKFETGEILSAYWNTLSKRQKIPFLIELIQELNLLFNELKRQAVVHCDIKPTNILVRRNDKGVLKISLIDFGLGVNTSKPIKRSMIFPLGFAAPELLLNQLQLVDHRTDQFALGISIWFLFTEKLPLSHPNPSIYTNLQLTHPLPDHSLLPKGVYPILNKMTHKHSFKTAPNLMNPNELLACLQEGMDLRYQSLDDIVSDFTRLDEKKKRWFRF